MATLAEPRAMALALAGGLLVLVAVLHQAVVRPLGRWRRRIRLRRPDAKGVAAVCGFPLPPGLVELYARAPFVDRAEFELVDPLEPSTRWAIGAFVPLRKRAVRQAREVHGVVGGVPVAHDGRGGVYVVVQSGAVVLRSAAVPGGEVRVAPAAGDLLAFEAVWPVRPLVLGHAPERG